jgi:predicted nicotinamide N-methyase
MFASEGFLKQLRSRTEVAAGTELVVERKAGPLRLSVSAEAGVGGMVWEAAAMLADWLGTKCAGARVVELGSGTGVLGLCLAQQGARKVVLTDRFDVLHLLRASVAANAIADVEVSVQELSWGGEEPMDLGEVDWLVASEVIYNGNLYDKLHATIVQIFRRNPTVQMVMSFERRSSEDRWLAMMRATFERVATHVLTTDKGKEIVVLECAEMKT